MQIKTFCKTVALASLAAVCLFGTARAAEDEDYARWYFSPGIGLLLTEGDQPLEDGMILNFRLGYDVNEWWSLEGGLVIAPSLDEQ